MLIPRPSDAVHKGLLLRLLSALADDIELMRHFRFKGGTCAALAGFLDRFSVDLDFDFLGTAKDIDFTRARVAFHGEKAGLTIKNESQRGIQFIFKYEAPPHARNTIKVDVAFPVPKNNLYAPLFLSEVDRTIPCQTRETMFANKLVATMDRFGKHESLAGRDIYDLHQFFLRGFHYHFPIIEERYGMKGPAFFKTLVDFIQKHFTQRILDEDLNPLLPEGEFKKIRTILKEEVIRFLRDEMLRK